MKTRFIHDCEVIQIHDLDIKLSTEDRVFVGREEFMVTDTALVIHPELYMEVQLEQVY